MKQAGILGNAYKIDVSKIDVINKVFSRLFNAKTHYKDSPKYNREIYESLKKILATEKDLLTLRMARNFLLAVTSTSGVEVTFADRNGRQAALVIQYGDPQEYQHYLQEALKDDSPIAANEIRNSIKILLDKNTEQFTREAKLMALQYGQGHEIINYLTLNRRHPENIEFCNELLALPGINDDDKISAYIALATAYGELGNEEAAMRAYEMAHNLGSSLGGVNYYQLLTKRNSAIDEETKRKIVADIGRNFATDLHRNYAPLVLQSLTACVSNFLGNIHNERGNIAFAQPFWKSAADSLNMVNPIESYEAQFHLAVSEFVEKRLSPDISFAEALSEATKTLSSILRNLDSLINRSSQGETQTRARILKCNAAHFLGDQYDRAYRTEKTAPKSAAAESAPTAFSLNLLTALRFHRVASEATETEDAYSSARYLATYYGDKTTINPDKNTELQDTQFFLKYTLRAAVICAKLNKTDDLETIKLNLAELLHVGTRPFGFEPAQDEMASSKKQMDEFLEAVTAINLPEGYFVYAQYLENHHPTLDCAYYYELAKADGCKFESEARRKFLQLSPKESSFGSPVDVTQEDQPLTQPVSHAKQAPGEIAKNPFELLNEEVERLKQQDPTDETAIANILARGIIEAKAGKTNPHKTQARQNVAAYIEKGIIPRIEGSPNDTSLLKALSERGIAEASFRLAQEIPAESARFLQLAASQGHKQAETILEQQKKSAEQTQRASLNARLRAQNEEKERYSRITRELTNEEIVTEVDNLIKEFANEFLSETARQKQEEEKRAAAIRQSFADNIAKNASQGGIAEYVILREQEEAERLLQEEQALQEELKKLQEEQAALQAEQEKARLKELHYQKLSADAAWALWHEEEAHKKQYFINEYCELLLQNPHLQDAEIKEVKRKITKLMNEGHYPQIGEEDLLALVERGVRAAHYPLFLLYKTDETMHTKMMYHLREAKKDLNPQAIFDYALIHDKSIEQKTQTALTKAQNGGKFQYYSTPQNNSDFDITHYEVNLLDIARLYQQARGLGCVMASLALAEFYSGKFEHCYIQKDPTKVLHYLNDFVENKGSALSKYEEELVRKLRTEMENSHPGVKVAKVAASTVANNGNAVIMQQ